MAFRYKSDILAELLRHTDQTVFVHGAIEALCSIYREAGVALLPTEKVVETDKKKLKGELVLAPISARGTPFMRRLKDRQEAFASGWMRVRARARQKGVELPLVISDHADWPDLCRTITETGAGEVWVTHGQEDALVHWCGTQGIKARPLHMLGYGDDGEVETAAEAAA